MPWKWDTILWDREGWMAGVGREFERLEDGRAVVRQSMNRESMPMVYHGLDASLSSNHYPLDSTKSAGGER